MSISHHDIPPPQKDLIRAVLQSDEELAQEAAALLNELNAPK